MVWQARTGLICHAVGSALGQDWRQETKRLLMQAILHGMESWGWDELESPPRRTPVCTALGFRLVRLASNGLAFLFLSTLPSFGRTQVKIRYTDTVWQLMNNIHLLQDESRRLCSITEEVVLLLTALRLVFLMFPHLLVTNLDFFVFLVYNTFVIFFFPFTFCPFYSYWHKFPPAPTKLSHLTASKIHGERKQSRAVYIPASPGLGRQHGYVPVLIGNY